LKFILKVSNNEVEYKALIAGVELCYRAGADSPRAFLDSQLVVSHLNGEYKVKDVTMEAYVRRV